MLYMGLKLYSLAAIPILVKIHIQLPLECAREIF